MRRTVPPDVLADVAAGGAADAGGLPVELLGDFLHVLTDSVMAGATLSSRQLRPYRRHGNHAAQQGIALRALLDMYLSAAWRLWRHLPPVTDAQRNPQAVVVAGEVMLHAVDDVVAELTEGFQLARLSLVRAQESARREFIDDLLAGGTELTGGFGLDLSGPHAVAVVRTEHPLGDGNPTLSAIERAIHGSKGDAAALVATKHGRIVVVFPARDQAAIDEVTAGVRAVLAPAHRRPPLGRWQLGVGRAGPGADAVRASYRDADDALTLADRLGLHTPIVDARELQVVRMLAHNRLALAELVEQAFGPLRAARGGAHPLLDTVRTYLRTGGNAARTARELHLSVRAVTYRLQRLRELTGLDLDDPDNRFTAQVAAVGAQVLDWPTAGDQP